MKVQTLDENLARYFKLPKVEGVIVLQMFHREAPLKSGV
jgi:hypothetical protein